MTNTRGRGEVCAWGWGKEGGDDNNQRQTEKDYLLCFSGVCNCSERRGEKPTKTVTRRDNKTQVWAERCVWCWELAAVIKTEIPVRRWGGQIGLIISADDNSVGGYHNEGGEDQTGHNVFIMWQKKKKTMTWLKLLLMPVMIVVLYWHNFNHRGSSFYIFQHNLVSHTFTSYILLFFFFV